MGGSQPALDILSPTVAQSPTPHASFPVGARVTRPPPEAHAAIPMHTVHLPVPLVLLLRKIFTTLSSFSVTSAQLISGRLIQHRFDEPESGEKGNELTGSLLDLLGWNAVREAVASLRWPWVVYAKELVPESGVEGGHVDGLEGVLENVGKRDKQAAQSERGTSGPPPPPPQPQGPQLPYPDTPIYRLLYHPLLFDPIRAPRNPIVLCHGLYGFDVRGPSSFPALQLHYWGNVLKILRGKVGADVICPGVPGTGSIESRAVKMDAFLREKAQGREVNFIAHSMGGLDCRHLISRIKPEAYKPLSLMSVCTPHRGSPFMDWCTANIGLGSPLDAAPVPPAPGPAPALPFSLKSPLLSYRPAREKLSFTLSTLPTSLTSLILSMLDSPAYANLTTSYLNNTFNPHTPDMPDVRYFSIAARTGPLSVLHPLWLPKLIMDAAGELEPDGDGGNDALVSVKSAKWGEFLGTVDECDHWEMRGARGFVRSFEVWNKSSGEREERAKGEMRDKTAEVRERVRETQDEAAGMRIGTNANGEGRAEREERGALERLSAVVEWMTEYVPLGVGSKAQDKDKDKGKEAKTVLQAFDLERFYVALSRKLYDEGL